MITENTTNDEIMEMLCENGMGYLFERVAEIKTAAMHGDLLWTPNRLVTTDASRIDGRPNQIDLTWYWQEQYHLAEVAA